MAIRSRTLLGGNCASVTAAGTSADGATAALIDSPAPSNKPLDLIRSPHLVIACIG
jgi:hypothetical protein